ncbi:MAG: DEAD/DEAH box helicase family protein, partial [Oscillospiraceae bacterium]|nr:DEAD/DEAH box helicase family protein [Oscillospiraceae bacterium]
YSLYEFDRLMKQADDEYAAGKTAAMAKYGTWQKWYDANDPEYNAFLGYDKVKFTVVLPDGRTFTERQDIGDGNGGVLDFLAQYGAYREIVPMLREAVHKEANAHNDLSTPPPEQGPASGRFWDAYNSIKERNPDSLVLYQVGDFFELYGGSEGEDARSAAVALDLTLTIRNIPEYGRVSMCGFPAHRLEDYVKQLNGKGYDVVVAALEDHRRVTSMFPAQPSEKAPQKADDFSDIDPAAVRAALAEHGIVDGHVVDEKKLDASPFIQQVMADVEQIAADAPPPDERFSVIETENGYAVWDDARNEIYVDSDGIQEEFTSEWQAEDYLKQVRKAVADKEAAEWLAVERAKQGQEPTPSVSQRRVEGKVAEYLFDQERIVIFQYPNGKFYNHYGYDEQRDFSHATAGGFDTLEEAEKTLLSHRPKAEKVLEPTEKEVSAEKGTESLADGHDHADKAPPLTPPAPRRRAKVSPFVLHPEIPSTDRHEYRITNDAIGVGTPGERFKNNIRAIRLLKKLEAEDRFATPEEQNVLAQYVGWGGLSDCFDERHSKYAELKALLTEDEYEAAAASTLTAFYTPPVVIRSIYQTLVNMGFKTGNLLEPSCGIGNFIGMRPDDLTESKIYGIELDSISGRIARQLYQKSSIAVQGFEKTDLPDSFFDAAIGNVPFGAFKVSDKRYNKHNFLIHDYFFARTLDKVRPGGIVAFITSKGTMDKENPSVRRYIAQRADLLGAVRLPNNTFKAAAGTEVTSDILFLQKRDALSCEEPDWVHLNTDENGLKMNQYFIDHPDMVMGEMQEISGPYGPETACLPREGQDLGEQLAAAIQSIQGSVTEYVMDDPEAEEEDQSIPADPEVRNFSYTVVDGQVYYRENSRMNPVEVSVTAANRIKGLIEIRDCVRTLIEYQTDDWPDENIQAEQQKLNTLYDAYVKKYGRISSRANSAAFRMDSAYFLLSSLEVLDDDRNFVRKADMFTKRTIKQKTVITSVDTASEALAVSLAEKACVDLGYMASLMGGGDKMPQIVEDLKGVIFKDPLTGPFDIDGDAVDWYKGWQTADEYLSGNVREKLATAKLAAKSDPAFQINVEALEKVQPVDLTASEISVRLGSTWLPPKVVEQFVFELLGTLEFAQEKIHVRYAPYTGEWNVEGKSVDKENVKANSTYGTDRINAYRIIEETLNLRDVRIYDYVKDSKGKKTAILNKQETAIAQGKQELIKQEFRDWIWKDPERREILTRLYNDQFNSERPREYDGSHLNFVGMNPEITLRTHQRNAIARVLYGGNTLLGHVVGAGKTWEMVAAAQESKRLGLCQKSLFVVPNHLTEQWATEYLQLYPSANILVATNKDFETKNRKRFCGRIATGDYDAIIIGHSQFEKVPISMERQIAILRQQRQEILDGIRELKESKGDHFSRKQMERTKKSIEAKLKELNDQSRKDDVVTFEELGVDRIFIDEAHYYKNLASFSKMRNVSGIAQTEAQKASDLYMKCRYLDEITGGRGVIFATGTPISNTMVEMFTMQKYLQYNTLKRHGLLHFDAWASTFGETVTAIELAPEGTGYRSKTRFAKFYNLPELMAMFKEVADIQTADMLNLPVPKANYHNVTLKPSELQEEMVEGLAERAERIRNKMVRSDVDNMLLVTNDGRKLALDQRMLNPLLPDSDTSKTNACADNVFELWQRTADQRSAQMVFCDLSTPKGNGDFNVYDDLRDKLIAKGIPAEEIAFIHDANTETKKKELFGKVRSGQVRILLGSTQRMGAGTNAQQKLVALHHLDCPWRPSDLQQREGRIIRQGNENDEVDIYTYVTENTFDSYLYQMVENKQKFIGQIMTSKSPVRSAEDIDETALSYAEIKALCTGDERIKEKMDLDVDVQRLKLLKSNHLSQKYTLEDQILKYFPREIAVTKSKIKSIQEDMAIRNENTHPNADGFSPMVIDGVTYTEKKGA